MGFKNSFLLAFFLFSISSQAKVFRNAYISFEIPDTWKCVLEQTEWVCRSEDAKESKEAIIILTAKEVGMKDSFAEYETHLNTPATLPTGGAESKVVYKAKTVQINDQQWLDGLHLGAEVGNYFTRYLATMKDKIAILVTFSAHKQMYSKYSQDFFKSVQSLRVIASKNLINQPDLGGLRPGSETLGPGTQTMPGDLMLGEETMNAAPKKKDSTVYIALALIVAAMGIFIFMKMKRK